MFLNTDPDTDCKKKEKNILLNLFDTINTLRKIKVVKVPEAFSDACGLLLWYYAWL